VPDSPVPAAPGDLELVRAFVNTLDVETGVDRLADAGAWRDWSGGAEDPDSDELTAARGLREALRDALLANHDGAAVLPDPAADALADAVRRAGLGVRFSAAGLRLAGGGAASGGAASDGVGSDGAASERVEPDDRGGVTGMMGRVAAITAEALADGTWRRLKVCANDACRWAFYDRSRSRTGQWCSMAICGNRAKQARWRDQRRPPASS